MTRFFIQTKPNGYEKSTDCQKQIYLQCENLGKYSLMLILQN